MPATPTHNIGIPYLVLYLPPVYRDVPSPGPLFLFVFNRPYLEVRIHLRPGKKVHSQPSPHHLQGIHEQASCVNKNGPTPEAEIQRKNTPVVTWIACQLLGLILKHAWVHVVGQDDYYYYCCCC